MPRRLHTWTALAIGLAICNWALAARAADAGPIENFKHSLVKSEGGKTVPCDATAVEGRKIYAIYYSAGWCAPSRKFTPRLVEFYNAEHPANPQFEVIFVSSDRTESAMEDYMSAENMPWPALKFSARDKLRKYDGPGIPNFVLLDETGKVLSASYVNGKYVGPSKVLEDLKTLLEQPQSATPQAPSSGSGGAGSNDFNDFFKKPQNP